MTELERLDREFTNAKSAYDIAYRIYKQARHDIDVAERRRNEAWQRMLNAAVNHRNALICAKAPRTEFNIEGD